MEANGSDVTSLEQMGLSISVITDVLHSICVKKNPEVSACVGDPISPYLPLSPFEKWGQLSPPPQILHCSVFNP